MIVFETQDRRQQHPIRPQDREATLCLDGDEMSGGMSLVAMSNVANGRAGGYLDIGIRYARE